MIFGPRSPPPPLLQAPAHTPNHTPASSIGGGERNRTDDLMLAKHALSQLSYTPRLTLPAFGSRLVGLDGFEPSTPALSRRCSNQLSYRPKGARPKLQAANLVRCSLLVARGSNNEQRAMNHESNTTDKCEH